MHVEDPIARRRALRALGPALLVATGVAMLVWTWRAWPDPLVDFGRELYVPWRLSQGARLFKDIAWFNGPLSQYWNAALFRLFGPGLIVLVWSNVLVLLACVWMLYDLIARLADRLTATVAGMVFLLVFAFGQYVGIGNYNWITPYSHELTHGIVLGLATLVVLARWRRTGSPVSLGVAGLAFGLCFLTKPEPFLAATAAVLVLLAPAVRRDGKSLEILLASAAVPVAVSAVAVGLRGTLGAWPAVLAGKVEHLAYYRADMGLDAPVFRIEEMLAWSGVWVLAIGAPAAAAWLGRGHRRRTLPLACAGATAIVLALLGIHGWQGALRPLPLAVLAIAGAALLARREGGDKVRADTALAFAAFGLALLLKMILRARVAHYGFALAMPATLLVVTALVGWIPSRLTGQGWSGGVVRSCVLVLVTFFAVAHLAVTGTWLSRKTEMVGTGRDRFRSDVRGVLVQRAVSDLDSWGVRTAAVLPEGVMINYLARIPNPTPYVNFMPPEEILFGGGRWAAAFRRSPPQVVLLAPKNTAEYGRGAFGVGYGKELARWVAGHYVPSRVIRVGDAPYGVRVLVRRDASRGGPTSPPPAGTSRSTSRRPASGG